MKTRFMIPALIAAATFSSGAFAHGGDRDHDWRGNRWNDQRYERRVMHMPPPVYAQPRVVYTQPVVYRPAPIYHVAPPIPLGPILIGAVIGGVIGDQFAR
jgi:hypothetical protein